MKRIICILFLGLTLFSCNQNNTEDNKIPQPAIIQDTNIGDITFNTVVDKGTVGFTLKDGGLGVSTVKYIIVDKNSMQDEVNKLANKLWYEYQSSDIITIAILNDYTAALNYENSDYDLSGSLLLLIRKDYENNEILYHPAFNKLPKK